MEDGKTTVRAEGHGQALVKLGEVCSCLLVTKLSNPNYFLVITDWKAQNIPGFEACLLITAPVWRGSLPSGCRSFPLGRISPSHFGHQLLGGLLLVGYPGLDILHLDRL